MDKIEVGSNAFFKGMEDFRSKDRDFLVLVDNPVGFNFRKETSLRGVDTFEYKNMSADEFITKTLEYKDALSVGKFLVKDFATAIGLKVSQLKKLSPLVEKLDEKHQYEKIIFDAIVKSGSWDLTDEVRTQAFESYKESRDTKKNEKKLTTEEQNTTTETETEE